MDLEGGKAGGCVRALVSRASSLSREGRRLITCTYSRKLIREIHTAMNTGQPTYVSLVHGTSELGESVGSSDRHR